VRKAAKQLKAEEAQAKESKKETTYGKREADAVETQKLAKLRSKRSKEAPR